MSLAGIGALAFVAGCVTLSARKPVEMSMVLAPLPFTLLASGLHKYPFGDRMILFAASQAEMTLIFASIVVLCVIGLVLYGRGQLEEAINEFQTALDLRNGNDAEAHRNLGRALYESGALEDARKECERGRLALLDFQVQK